MNQMLTPATRSRPAATPVRGPIRLTRERRIAVYAIAAVLWLSGVVWLVFHTFVRTEGPFGAEQSPLEPWWLKLHGLAAFATLWAAGLLWGVHIVNGWKAGRRRTSGAVLLGALAFLAGSGYLLYYSGSEELRSVVSIEHWVLGLAAPIAFVWHRWLSKEK